MRMTKIITSLTLAASLAAGMTLVMGSQSAFAKQVCVTDHRGPGPARKVCNEIKAGDEWKYNPDPSIRQQPVNVDHNRPNEVIVSQSRVVGKNADGSPKWLIAKGTDASEQSKATNRIVHRYNKDGSVDTVQELRQPDGTWKDQGVTSHRAPRTPKSVTLGSCPFWGC